MNDYDLFNLSAEDILRDDLDKLGDEWRLLRRLSLPDRLNNSTNARVRYAAALDVETTGLSAETDEVIQLALLPFSYEAETGRVLEIQNARAFQGFREPGVAISEDARAITGITPDMVAGKSIDEGAVLDLLKDIDLIIAHNAAFDRPMVEKHWPAFAEKPWACSLRGVNWTAEGMSAGKLDYLGMKFGWFFDGHRALADCEACIALLAQTLPISGDRVLSAVRKSASRKDFLIQALGSPYHAKEKLKARGYRWRPEDLPKGKVWWTITDDFEAECTWLEEEVFQSAVSLPKVEVTAYNRYSQRIWD